MMTDTKIQFRIANSNDISLIIKGKEEIMSIQNESHYWSDNVKLELEQKARESVDATHAPHRVLIAELNEQAVGFVSFVNSSKTPYVPCESLWWHEHTWISYVWVDKEFRGRGIAEALMRRADEHAIESGLAALYDDVYECNSRSQAFHEKCGFRHYAQVSMRENLDFNALRNSVASLRLMLPSVELERYDSSDAKHREAIHFGLIEIYGAEGDYGQPYGQNPDAQRDEESRFDQMFGSITTVARDGNAIIGWISCAKDNMTPFGVHYGEWWHSFASLSYIWVSREHRRRNIAQLLLDNALLEVGESIAISSFVIENQPSKNWHDKQHFIPLVRIYHKQLEQTNQTQTQ